MSKFTTIIFLLLVISSNAQDVISEDSLFQDPTLRKANVFEHLTLPDILFDNGVPLIEN